MKKLLRLLLLFVMFMPLIAKADMGAPFFREYKAVVVKEGGTDYYSNVERLDKEGRLAKDRIITITFEDRANGVDYLMFKSGDRYYFVKASDVMPIEKEVKVTDDNVANEGENIKIRVYADEVDVRKGPSKAYEKVGTLKKGTEGTYRYFIADSAYIYVETNDISGWVDSIDETVLMESKKTLVAAKDIKLSCTTVPAGTVIKSPMVTDDWSRKIFVEKNGCSQLVSNFKNASFVNLLDNEEYYELLGDVEATSAPGKKSDMVIQKGNYVTIKSDFFFEEGSANSYYYADFNGKDLWIKLNIDKKAETLKEVKSIPTKPEEKKEEKEDDKKEDKKDEKEDKEDKGLDTKTIVLICVIVGLSIALAAIVVILLVNKKKDGTKEVKESVVEKADILDELEETPEEIEEAYEEELAEKNIALAEEYERQEKEAAEAKEFKHAKKNKK